MEVQTGAAGGSATQQPLQHALQHTLHGVRVLPACCLQGLGDVLLGSMGLRLRILPSCACPEGEGGGNLAAACDGASGGDQSGLGLWRHRVALESCSAGEEGCRPLGLIYLDPGGGGGTRQLRFVR